MIVVNFSHPLAPYQREQAASACGQAIDRVIEVATHCDPEASFAEQAAALAHTASLTTEEWQTRPILVVPPSLAAIACACVAELHGRMGYFPPLLRLRPRVGSMPPVFDVAEIVNLQAIRDAARRRR